MIKIKRDSTSGHLLGTSISYLSSIKKWAQLLPLRLKILRYFKLSLQSGDVRWKVFQIVFYSRHNSRDETMLQHVKGKLYFKRGPGKIQGTKPLLTFFK